MPAKRAHGASRQPAATVSSSSAAAAAKGAATSSVLVHRCRFVDQVPDPVESLQYDPSCLRLAVLRANSDIELWSLSEGGWFREAYVPGVPDTPVRRLALGSRTASHPDGRLFSCGLHGVVTEWDLARLSPLDNYDSLGGAAWSLALHASSARLAAGCEDGGVTVFGMVEEGLENVYRLPARGGRVLSLAFSSSGGQLVAGGADGSVRLWALGGGGAARHTCQFVLESEGRKRPPLVWDVLLLPDSLVVTADSSGRVCFYDGRHGTLVNRFRSHEADVLALAATADGSHVFASGVDHKVSLFTPQPEELKPHQQPLAIFNLAAPRPPRQYLLNCSRRPHTHDVRALLVVEPPPSSAASSASSSSAAAAAAAAAAPAAPALAAAAGAAPVPAPLGGGGGSWLTPQLVSAGLDTQLVLLSLDGFERCSPSKLLPPPLPSSCSVAPQARLLAAHGVSEVRLWQLPLGHASPPAGERGGAPPLSPEPRQLLLLKPSSLSRHLFCASASSDGRWLLASDASPRLYRIGLEPHGGEAGAGPAVTRVPLPDGAAAAVCAAFSADSRLLLLGTTLGTLQALPLDAASDAPPFIHTLRPPLDDPAGEDTGDAVADGTLAAVLRLSLSSDLQWAAAADARRGVSIYSLDALAFHGAMPRLSSPPAALAFVPGTPLLAVATVDKRLLLFDADALRLVPAACAAGSEPLQPVRGHTEAVLRIVFNQATPLSLLLCAQTWSLRVDLNAEAHPSLRRMGAAAAVAAAAAAAAAAVPPPVSEAAEPSAEGVVSAEATSMPKRKRKRKRSGGGAKAAAAAEPRATDSSADGTRLLTKYGPMRLFDFVAPGCAVVVEQPWLRVMERFPNAMVRHQFGT